MDLNLILMLIGTLIGLISAVSAIMYIFEKMPYRRFRWKKAEKVAKKIAEELVKDDFLPSLIVGIGRGGAIMGALISGCLGHRPLLVIDREYKWKNETRFEDMIFHPSIPPQFLERVLIVSGEVHTGNTMKFYCDYFKKIGAKEIRKATFFYEKGATVIVEYIGIKSSKKNVLMPWMFDKKYLRADRHPPTQIS